MSALAIIIARGGSKRIPRKNIRPFRGKPILAWPLQAALDCGRFAEVMVSTDDAEIAGVARQYGAAVPFPRSARAADDFATTADVLLEVLETYRSHGRTFETACCIYPTASFITADSLNLAYERLQSGPFDVVMPVVAFSHPIWRAMQRDESERIGLIWPENLNERSQDLPPCYHDAGQFYWFRVEPFLHNHVLMGPNTGAIVLPDSHVQDIDNEADWDLAELKHQWITRVP